LIPGEKKRGREGGKWVFSMLRKRIRHGRATNPRRPILRKRKKRGKKKKKEGGVPPAGYLCVKGKGGHAGKKEGKKKEEEAFHGRGYRRPRAVREKKGERGRKKNAGHWFCTFRLERREG